MSTLPKILPPEDVLSLKRAHEHLEHPSFAIRLSNVIGTPIEMALKLLPRRSYRLLRHHAEAAMWRILNTAVSGLKDKQGRSSDAYYKAMGIASGAVGGFFGGPALLLELPFTTSVMLRTIADIARAEGEDLDDLDTRMACLEVFALGGHSRDDDAAETGYYGLRMALEAPIAGASRYIAQNGLVRRGGAPVLVDCIATVSQRFGATLSERAAAGVVPVIGALGAACVNSLFIQHFQDMARSHFTIRRLERQYGPRLVQAEYAKLSKPLPPVPRLVYAPA
jgi:hypothetical protein